MLQELFPYEIKMALEGLNSDNRRKILSTLKDFEKMSFTEISEKAEIEGSLLANHLKHLTKSLLIEHYYERGEDEKYYSYYKLSPFCSRVVISLNNSLYIKKRETVECQIIIKKTTEYTYSQSNERGKLITTDISGKTEVYQSTVVENEGLKVV